MFSAYNTAGLPFPPQSKRADQVASVCIYIFYERYHEQADKTRIYIYFSLNKDHFNTSFGSCERTETVSGWSWVEEEECEVLCWKSLKQSYLQVWASSTNNPRGVTKTWHREEIKTTK